MKFISGSGMAGFCSIMIAIGGIVGVFSVFVMSRIRTGLRFYPRSNYVGSRALECMESH